MMVKIDDEKEAAEYGIEDFPSIGRCQGIEDFPSKGKCQGNEDFPSKGRCQGIEDFASINRFLNYFGILQRNIWKK